MTSMPAKPMVALGTMLLLVPAQRAPRAIQVPPPAKRQFALHGLSPSFRNLMSRDAKLNTLATGFGFTEGPVWETSGFVYVSDETLNKIFRVYPDGHKETLIALGDPDGNTFDRHHRLLDCASVLRAVIAVVPDAVTRSWPTGLKAGGSTAPMTW